MPSTLNILKKLRKKVFNRSSVHTLPLEAKSLSEQLAKMNPTGKAPVWPDSDSYSAISEDEFQDTFYDPSRGLYGYISIKHAEPGHKIKLVTVEEQQFLNNILLAYENCYIYDQKNDTFFFNCAGEINPVQIADKKKFKKTLNCFMNKDGLNFSVRHLSVEELEELITSNGGHSPKINLAQEFGI